jgi:hypothetical protein
VELSIFYFDKPPPFFWHKALDLTGLLWYKGANMSNSNLDKIALEFGEKLYALISENVNGDDSEELMMKSAIVLKTAIEMYVMQFDEDIHIENLLEVAAESIPLLREKVENMPLPFESKTIH